MLEWYVYRYNINSKKIEKYNVFDHFKFKEDVLKAYGTFDREELSEKINSAARYYFWSKYEWEIDICEPLSEGKCAKKIDVYDQLRLNWDSFIDYIYTDYISEIIGNFKAI